MTRGPRNHFVPCVCMRVHVCVLNPNLKVENSSVVVFKALVGRDDVRQHLLVERQRCNGCQEPAVA